MNKYGISFKEDLAANWEKIMEPVGLQLGDGIPMNTEKEITLFDFLERFNGRIHTSVTRICEPPQVNFIVEMDGARLWFSVCVEELFKEGKK